MLEHLLQRLHPVSRQNPIDVLEYELPSLYQQEYLAALLCGQCWLDGNACDWVGGRKYWELGICECVKIRDRGECEFSKFCHPFSLNSVAG